MSDFVHLHVHTHYSLLDGATRIVPLIEKTKAMGMDSIAISDHGNLFGAIEFYTAAKGAGVKPIVGCEVYMAPGDRRDKDARGMREASYHLLLLAMNLTGYRNLLRLTSIAYREGFYYRPRIDKAILTELNEGLICTSTCLGGEIPQALLGHNRQAAEDAARTYLSIFGPERFFIELQNHNLPEQAMTNPELADIGRKLGVGCIATNDVHYLDADDVEAHDVLCCISTGKLLSDEGRFKFPSDQFFLKSVDEMRAAMPDYEEALRNTARVAELCNLELDFSKRYAPVYHPPEQRNPDDYLRDLVYEGAAQKYEEISDELRERIDYELGVVASKGFSSYFLIVWDFVHYARSRGIPCGARGSGCSSVVGYCLGLSAPDPLRYGLFFERFMDPDRDEMPDIDIDICQDARGEVIEYVRKKYGHVAQIITFNRLGAKAVIRDVSRVMGVPLPEADKIAKLIPAELHMTIDRALEQEPELQALYKSEEQVRHVIDVARKLEGLTRHAGIHAAGVVVADQPLDNFLPLYRAQDDEDIVTQYDGNTVEKVGLLKMDFLGLRTLSVIEKALQLVKQHRGLHIDVEKADITDQKVYELFARGQTRGIFQFESGGMRDVVMRMRPNRIEDLIAANALYRPGPMVNIDAYVARKHGEKWKTPHPIMDELLADTYGIMVYQEQVSRVVNRLGNIELKRAFRLAKAISKKKTKMIEAEREPFLSGAVENGVNRATAEQIFEEILRFGGYAFNLAHSTGYALIAFQTAFLKTYYPLEFMAAVLTYEMSSTDKIVEYVDECRKMGIDVKPPDVNVSDAAFTVVPEHDDTPGHIRFGLAAIKGVGTRAVEAIVAARREGGPFRSIFDFCERIDTQHVNRATIEALIKAGAFDSTGGMRKALMTVLPSAIDVGAQAQDDRRAGQMGLFGGGDEASSAAAPEPVIPTDEWTEAEMLSHEKSVLGLYVTAHPLTEHVDVLEKFATARTADLDRYQDGADVVLGGMITRMRTVTTKTGRSAGSKMGIVTFEDLSGQVEVILFPDLLEQSRSLIAPERIVFVVGRVDRRREEPSVRVSELIPIERAPEKLARAVLIRMNCAATAVDMMPRLRHLCDQHRGERPIYMEMTTADGLKVTVRCNGGVAVTPSEEFVEAIDHLLGPGHVILVPPTKHTMAAAPRDEPRAIAAPARAAISEPVPVPV